MGRLIFLTTLAFALLLADDEVARAGELTGKVTVKADEKPQRPRRYYKGRYRSGRGDQRTTGPMDVVVWVVGAGSAPVAPMRPRPVMRQKDETFIPRVLAVTVGTTVEFPNEDNFYHNVFSLRAGDDFNLGRYASGRSKAMTFTTPGPVVVFCEIHSRMQAFIRVLDTPYFTIPDADGKFAIPDLPAGTYELVAWHPPSAEVSRSITVPASGSIEINLSF